MKILLIAALGSVLSAGVCLGQVITLIVTPLEELSEKSVVLGERDYAEILDASHPDATSVNVAFADGSINKSILHKGGSEDTRNPPVIAGPATIRARRVSTNAPVGYITLRVTRQGTDGIIPVPQSPSNTDYEVFLEASSDMETWVRVIPGDYSSNGAAKFFRVRMVAK